MLVKSLVALATEKMLLKTSGKTFLKGIAFMYAAGLAPERLSVMMTSSQKYILQFHSKCDIRPFAANYPTFARVLRGIVHVRAWRIRSIEFVNVAFDIKDVDNLERTIEKLGVELVLLRNCTYPNVEQGEQAVRLLNALNRKKLAVVCEYGDERLKHKIAKRARHTHDRATEVNEPEAAAEGANDQGDGMRQVMNALRRRYPYHLRRRNAGRIEAAVAGDLIMQAIQQGINFVNGGNPSPMWAFPMPNAAPEGAAQFAPPPPQQAQMVGEPVEPVADHPAHEYNQQQDMDIDDGVDRPPQFYRVGDDAMGEEGEEVTEEDVDL